MQPTDLLYMKDFELLEVNAKVLSVEKIEDERDTVNNASATGERHIIILDQTIFTLKAAGSRTTGAQFLKTTQYFL